MDDINQPDATAVWDARYEKGDHVGTQKELPNDPIDYTQHKFLYGHSIAKPMTGSLDGWSVDTIGQAFLRPAPERMLAIGSGMAFIEEYLLSKGYAKHITAYEMSGTAVQATKQRVADKEYAHRLDIRSADVLAENLPDASFDAVFVQAAIHHFFAIEDMYRLMHRVLKPGGLLWFDEYIGPDHHIYDPHVMAIMNEINECLAPAYRWDHLAHHERHEVPKPSLDFMMGHDPSEGVHASRIMPLTYQYFDVVHRQDYGGAIMRPFFTGILPNFDWNDPKDQTVARLIILAEQLLTRNGVIPNYHSAVVGRRRDTVRPPLTAEEQHRITYSDWRGLAPAPAGRLSKLASLWRR